MLVNVRKASSGNNKEEPCVCVGRCSRNALSHTNRWCLLGRECGRSPIEHRVAPSFHCVASQFGTSPAELSPSAGFRDTSHTSTCFQGDPMPFYSNPFFISVVTNLTKALHLKVSLPFGTISSPFPLPCLAGVVRPVGLGMESTLSATRLLLEGRGSRCTVKMPGPGVWV